MAYPEIHDENFIDDLYRRKEIYSIKGDPERNFRDVAPGDHEFKLHSYQLFIQRLINPNTPYKRQMLMYPPGIGKTFSAIAICQTFIDLYKTFYAAASTGIIGDKRKVAADADRATPSIFIFGFDPTKKAFYRDLMRYPELGFITAAERDALANLAAIAARTGLLSDRKRYRDEESYLKRRITQKSKDGFYKFIGYQKLVNLLFAGESNLVALEREAIRTGATLEELVARDVLSGKITINQEFLKLFRNSVIVCDEAQHMYNSYHKNNYGVAVQYILDVYMADITLVLLTATPINNSPSEIVETLNFLIPTAPGVAKIKKSDLFANKRDLLPGALQRIGELCRGRISFVQDSNPAYFPKRLFAGNVHVLARETQGMREIPYVPLTNCEMSEFHRATYLDAQRKWLDVERAKTVMGIDANATNVSNMVDTPTPGAPIVESSTTAPSAVESSTMESSPGDDSDEDEEPDADQLSAAPGNGATALKPKAVSMSRRRPRNIVKTEDEDAEDFDSGLTHIPVDGYSIYDIAFPSPDSETIGLFRSVETRGKLQSATQEWRDAHGIEIKRKGSDYIITGNFLLRENIGKYSTKFAKLLDTLDEIIERSSPAHSAKVAALMRGVAGAKSKTEEQEILVNVEKAVQECGEKIAIYHDRVKMSGVKLIGELLRVNGYLDEFSEPIDRSRCAFCPHRMAGHAAANAATPHAFTPFRFVSLHSDVERNVMDASMARYNSPDNTYGIHARMLIGSKIIREGYDFLCTRHNILMGLPVNIPAMLQEMGRFSRKNSHRMLPPRERTVTNRFLVSTIAGEVTAEELRWVEKMNDYRAIQEIERELHANAVDAGIHRDLIMPRGAIRDYFPSTEVNAQSKLHPHEPIYEMPGTAKAVLGNLYYDVKAPREYRYDELDMTTFNAYKYYEGETQLIQNIILRLFKMQPVWQYDGLWKRVREPPVNLELNPKLFSEGNFAIALTRLTEKPNVDYAIEQVGRYYIRFPVANGKVIRDVDSFLRAPRPSGAVTVDVDKWVSSAKSDYNYNMRKMRFKTSFCNTSDVIGMLMEFDSEFYEKFLTDVIQYKVDGKPTVDEKLRALYDRVIDLFSRFKCVVTAGEAAKFRDIAKKFVNGRVVRAVEDGDKTAPARYAPHIAANTPVGFVVLNGIRLYDSPDWIETSKTSMNVRTQFVEDATCVGYLDDSGGRIRFKIRKPLQLTNREGVDIRTIEKGAVCSTKSKEELTEIAHQLQIKNVHHSGLVRDLCEEIKRKLIENEIRHRQRDEKYKALYLWNETRP